jgi:aryl-alcohol dehydrogenase-like predicted oxidoreductase
LKTRKLGSSDLAISPIGFGAWAIGGGGWEFGWGPQDDLDSTAAIRAAVDRGVNWIDTAAVYGLGHSEEMIGRALQGLATPPFVFTKCTLVWDAAKNITHNLEAASIRREAEASLRRLQLDRIDLYQIHWPAWKGRPEGEAPGSLEEAVGAMALLQKEGKICHIGLSNCNAAQIARAQAVAPVVSIQPKYSLLYRNAEKEILPYAREAGIGVIVYSPMASGLLSGTMTRERVARMPADDWRRASRDFQEPNLTQNLKLADLLVAIGKRHGRTAGEVAIAWTLRNPAVTGAIVGIRHASQLDGVIGAGDLELADAEVSQIEGALAQRATA